jgi:hypothetical protein
MITSINENINMDGIYNPWNPDHTIDTNINKEYFFVGPKKLNNKNQYIRYNIPTKIFIKNNGNIIISSIERGESGYLIFQIILKNNNEAHIENISRTSFYSGSDIMIFILQILYRLNIKKCSLKDSSYIDCKRNNFFKITEVPLKILKLLKNGNTFYSAFRFNPISKSNNSNCIDTINTLIGKLYDITWNELDEIIEAGKKEINISNETEKNINYNKFIIVNINKWKKYWKSIYNSWINFKIKYRQTNETPFRAFSVFDENHCSDYLGWLEIYSYTFTNFNKVIYYNFLNKKYEIPNIKIFNKLKDIINNVNWINRKITAQPNIFIKNHF